MAGSETGSPVPRLLEGIPVFLQDAHDPREVAELLHRSMQTIQGVGVAALDGQTGLEVVVGDTTAEARFRDATDEMVRLVVDINPHPYMGTAVSLDTPNNSYADLRLNREPGLRGANWRIGERGIGFTKLGFVSRFDRLPVSHAELGQLVSGAQYIVDLARVSVNADGA